MCRYDQLACVPRVERRAMRAAVAKLLRNRALTWFLLEVIEHKNALILHVLMQSASDGMIDAAINNNTITVRTTRRSCRMHERHIPGDLDIVVGCWC